MCGIVAYMNSSGRPVDYQTFSMMTNILTHRGPDDKGIEVFPGRSYVALGHNRLSIIDLSPAGHQPMANKDRTLWIVFNGEIFNYQAIRKTLIEQDYVFTSESDTEVILNAYQLWGEKCIDRLNGMFAFVIWDSKRQLLFAARDRLGIKPLYYYQQEDTLILASEVKSILAAGGGAVEPDWTALCTPFHYQVSPDTGFKNIKKLFPGHYIRFSQQRLELKKYWDIKPSVADLTEHEAIEKLSSLIEDSVHLQMISDVPVGAFLSGGLDSSLIVALMTKLSNTPVSTFTIRFEEIDQGFEAGEDDSKYARKIANIFGCEHKEIIIKPDIINLLPKMIWHLDEPLADPAAINTYLISKAARHDGVKVLLNGVGGDEVFGGYRKHLACMVANKYEVFTPLILRKMINQIINHFSVANSTRGFRYMRWLKHFMRIAATQKDIRFLAADMAAVSPDFYPQLFISNHSSVDYRIIPCVAKRKELFSRQDIDYLKAMCLDDTKHFLPDHNLTYADKATMAASVEGRPPLVDHRIVEFMFSLPPQFHIKGLIQKYILKKYAESLLPRDVIYRPKAPFGSPLRSWIRRELREMVDDILSHSALKRRGIFNPVTVRTLIQSDRDGKEDHALLIWSILTRELWFRTFIDKSVDRNSQL